MNNNAEHITGNLEWDGLSRPKIYYAVASLWCGIFLSVMDGNICNVALPTISQELGVSSADSIWVVNSFQLVIMMTLLSFSSIGELLSYKRVYVSGTVLFTVGSLFCALSHTLPLLVASRAFQGLGAAMMMSVNTTLVKITYPKKYLGRGVGLNATVVALASVAGPTVAAGILSFASWPWLFAINIPVGIVTFFMAFKHLPDNPTHIEGRHFNIRDGLLNAAVFGLLIGCIEMYSHGAKSVTVLVGVALLVVLGSIYVRTQLRRRWPMLPFDLLRIPVFSMSVLTSIISFTAQMTAMVAIPFMLLHTFGMNAVETGLLMSPDLIAKASFLAMEAGADFIKTSTGKVSVNATPAAAYTMCECIAAYYRKTGRKVGFKPAGGISSVLDAVSYYTIVSTVLGEEWLDKSLFRFGVSRMANNIISELEQKTVSYF